MTMEQTVEKMTRLIALEGEISTMLDEAKATLERVKVERQAKIAERDALRKELTPLMGAALGMRTRKAAPAKTPGTRGKAAPAAATGASAS